MMFVDYVSMYNTDKPQHFVEVADDIVSDLLTRPREHFGEPRKTWGTSTNFLKVPIALDPPPNSKRMKYNLTIAAITSVMPEARVTFRKSAERHRISKHAIVSIILVYCYSTTDYDN